MKTPFDCLIKEIVIQTYELELVKSLKSVPLGNLKIIYLREKLVHFEERDGNLFVMPLKESAKDIKIIFEPNQSHKNKNYKEEKSHG